MTTQKKNAIAKRQWWRMDMHLHTMASADWKEPGVGWLDWLYRCEQRGLDIVAITDHNTVAGIASLRKEIERLGWLEADNRLRPNERRALDEYRRLGNDILVLPGFEITATFGFHILAIFPAETSVRELEHILLDLNVPADRLDIGSTEVGATTDVLTIYRIVRQAGGLVIAAHANSTHGVAMRDFPFGGQTKIAYTQDLNLHALEVTDLESRSTRATSRFFNGSKPEYPRRMRCIQGSDAHRVSQDPREAARLGIGDRVTEIKLSAAPTFKAIKKVFESNDFALTRPYRRREDPFDHVAAAREQGPSIVQSFHERVTRQGGRLYGILSDVVAFANTHGGTIYVGVSPQPGPPAGIERTDETIAELKTEIESKLVPPLEVEIDAMESQGRQVVRIQVPIGPDKPYCLEDSRIFLRQEGESALAVRDEIVQLVRQALLDRGELAPPVRLEPAPTEPVPTEAVPPKRRRTKRNGDSKPAAEPVPSGPVEVSVPVAFVPTEEQPPIRPPKIGVQIVDVKERGGTLYYAIRDLRNGSVVQNVTFKSARRLWRYAISQHEHRPADPEKIQWMGDAGLVRVEKRAGKQRYDFCQRLPGDNSIAVYYGVTEEGCEDPWTQFLVGLDADLEDRPEIDEGPEDQGPYEE